MGDQDHYEGFEKEGKFHFILAQAISDCPMLKARTVKKIIANIDPSFTEDLFVVRPCVRKLRYIGCGCVESTCPPGDSFFTEGAIYTSVDFNGGTYAIEGYEDGKKRIGSAYFEWIKETNCITFDICSQLIYEMSSICQKGDTSMKHILIRIFCLSLLLALIPCQIQAAPDRALTITGKRFALIIGNSAYKSSPLKNPVNDAQDISAALKRNGFHVVLKENGTRKAMVKAISDFGGKLTSGSVGFFYYAGHGMQVKGVNYLIPVDADISAESDLVAEAVDINMLLSHMEDARNAMNIVVLDACRDNPFARSFRSSSRGLAKVDAPRGTIIAYATAPNSTAADGEGRNGIFTRHLLKIIDSPGLSVVQVFQRTSTAVSDETGDRQMPWLALSPLKGDFYFNTKRVSPLANVDDSGGFTVDYEAENRKLVAEEERLRKEAALEERRKALAEERRRRDEAAEAAAEQKRLDAEEAKLRKDQELIEKKKALAEKKRRLEEEREALKHDNITVAKAAPPEKAYEETRWKFNYRTAKMYIDEASEASKNKDYQTMLDICEEALSRIKQKSLKATPDDIKRIEHRIDIAQDMMSRK